MAPKKKTLNNQKIIHAGLQAMAAQETMRITMGDIAEKLKISELELYPFIQKPADIFNLITRQVNKALAETYIRDPDVPKQDQYFDLVMERLDLLQPYKTDINRFTKAIPKNPLVLAGFYPDFERSMILMMRLAGDLPDQKGHYTKRVGLTWVYLSTMKVWAKDNSEDNAKTMAHLDKCLGRLQNLKDKSPFNRNAA